MRLLPPFTLLVLSPFVGEFLLGNIEPDPRSWATVFLPLVLLYGGGALLIREVARRFGRGYPTIATLALAYALVEEGIVLGTLFNREYLGLGLLEYGWLPQLGTSPVWTSYVLVIHCVWSILVPIVLTERLFPAHADEPWLRAPGTILVTLIYLLGAVATGAGNYYTYRFFPSSAQVLTVLAFAVVCVVAGLLIRPSRRRERGGRVPAPGVLAAVTLCTGSVFILVQPDGAEHGFLPFGVTLAIMALAVGAAGATLMIAGQGPAWSVRHVLGAAAGALATYIWAGFMIQFSIHGFSTVGLLGQIGFALIALALLASCWRRSVTVRGGGRASADVAAASSASHWAR